MELVRQKNVATYIFFPLRDADGLNVTGSGNPDSEKDMWSDGAAPNGFADCDNEAVEIGTDGWYYLLLAQAEMNFDYIAIQVKSDDALTQNILIRTINSDPMDMATETNVNANETKIDTMQGNVTDILGDTDTMEADLKTYLDAIEANLDGDIVAVKTDTGNIDTKTTNLPGDPASETNVNANETKIDLIQTDTTNIDNKTTNLPGDPASETNVDATETKVDTVITNIGNLENLSAANVQTVLETNDLDHLVKIAHPTGDPVQDSLIDLIMNKDAGQTYNRATDSLEIIGEGGGGATAQQVWEYASPRALSTPNDYKASGYSVPNEYDGVLATIQADLDNPGQFKADVTDMATETNVNANETKIDTLQGDVTAIKNLTDNLPADTKDFLEQQLGLADKNSYIDNIVVDGSNRMTSCRKRIYDNKANAITHGAGGLLHTFNITVTYTNGDLESYLVTMD